MYALGCLLYLILAGRPPYDGARAADVLAQVRGGPPVPLRLRQRGLPEDLLAIADQAMARDRAARYPSAAELAADLRRFQTGQLVAAYRYSWWKLTRRWAAQHRALVAGVGAAIAVAATVGAFSVRRIVVERDRAEQALAREAESNDRGALAQARSLVDHDPTAALGVLRRIRPGFSGWSRVREIAGAAEQRGLARQIFELHAPVVALEVSPDGTRLAAVDEERRLSLWRVEDATVETLATLPSMVRALAFSPDGRWLAVAAGGARMWEVATRRERVLDAGAEVTALAFARDGSLALGGSDGRLQRIAPGGGAAAGGAPGGAVLDLAVAPDGALVARRAREISWRASDGTSRSFAAAAPAGASGLAVSRDGRWLAAAAAGGALLWPLPSGEPRRLAVAGPLVDLAFSPDGARLAALSADGALQVWSTADGVAQPLAHAGAMAHALAYSADGALLAVTRGPMVRVYDAAGRVRKLRGHSLEVTRVRFGADASWVASASLDGTVRLWRLTAAPPPDDPAALRRWLEAIAPR